jgi:hypothetical protein
MHIPNAASKYKREMQNAHRTKGMTPVRLSNPMLMQLPKTIARPNVQANFFGAASTHSGRCGLTIQLANIRLGTQRVETNRRKKMSIMKVMPKALRGW